jgi:hypothetical protein
VSRGKCAPRLRRRLGLRCGRCNCLAFRFVGVLVRGGLPGCSSKGSGHRRPACRSAPIARRQGVRGRHCADPGNGVRAAPARRRATARAETSATAHRRLHDGRRPRHGAACRPTQCRPPLRCSLNGFYGTCAEGGSVDQGGACTATADCLSGLWCGANGQCGVLKGRLPAVRGRDVHRRRPVPRVLRGARAPANRRRTSIACRSRMTSASPGARSTSRTSPSPDRRRWASTW